MKVILVDPNVDYYNRYTADRGCMTGVVTLKRKEKIENNDRIAEEILANVGPLTFKIELEKVWNDLGHVEVTVKVLLFSDTEIESKCVLRRLWDRFQNRAKITTVIRYDRDPKENEEELEFATVEGMIESEISGCISKGSACTDKAWLDPYRVNLQIIAEIPDDCLAEKQEMSFSQKIFETSSCSDVIILAGNGAEIKAHKSFLSVCSAVLAAMFLSGMQESQTGRVDMTDLSENGVRAFLQFIYFEDLNMPKPKEDIEIAFELLYASHKYHVPTLEAKMIICLMDVKDKDFRLGLAFKVYMFVRNMGSPSAVELKRKCIQIFNMKLDELESLKEYQDLFQKTPKVAMEVSRDFLQSVFRRKL